MRAVDLYENTEIDDWLDQVVKGSWTRNDNGIVEVKGFVDIPKQIKTLPVQFGFVSGSFYCYNTKIISLKGAPKEVHGDFDCAGTKIISLEGSPKKVGKHFVCSHTNISSLEGAPKVVGGVFDCAGTKITDPYEYRYALLSVIGRVFTSSNEDVNKIINTYGWDGSNDPKSKRKVPIGLQKLKELSNESN